MAGRMEGKVAFVTGAARGQGRSHAVRLAQEGADIIAVDICESLSTVNYPLATPDDLAETARLVEKHDRRIVTVQADVRERSQMVAALDQGLAEFGKVDVVVANAGIAAMTGEPGVNAWIDTIDTNLLGVINAVQAALPHLQAGASLIATGSTAALIDVSKTETPGTELGGAAYVLAKRQLTQFMHMVALHMAPRHIRANVIHPTNCNTDMLQSEPMYKAFRPDLEHPTRADAEPGFAVMQAMPIPYVEPEDITNAVLFLASDESRYMTGMQLRIDGGGYLKWYDFKL